MDLSQNHVYLPQANTKAAKIQANVGVVSHVMTTFQNR